MDEKYYEKLVKDGSITIYRDDGSSDYLLLPKSEYAEQIKKCKIAKEKNSRNAVMLYKDVALIASVENNTLITAVEKERAKENIFTNVDSVVIL